MRKYCSAARQSLIITRKMYSIWGDVKSQEYALNGPDCPHSFCSGRTRKHCGGAYRQTLCLWDFGTYRLVLCLVSHGWGSLEGKVGKHYSNQLAAPKDNMLCTNLPSQFSHRVKYCTFLRFASTIITANPGQKIS